MTKREKLGLLSSIIFIGFFASLFYHYLLGKYLFNLPFPYNTFLFVPDDRFGDFTNLYESVRNMEPYSYGLFLFPPFASLLLYPFTMFPELVGLAILIAVFIIFHFLVCYKYLSIDGKISFKTFISISCLTYPFLFSVDRANFELLVYIMMFLFIYFYQHNKYLLSSYFLAFSIATKIYPAVFIVLLVSKKRYKEVLYTFITVCIIIIVSLLLFKDSPQENIARLINNWSFYTKSYVENISGWAYGSSLWGAFKVLYFGFIKILFGSIEFANNTIHNFKIPYALVTLSLFGICSYFVIFREVILWRQVTVLVICMNLLPFVTGDYRLMHFYIPLALFINSEPSKSDYRYITIFALLLIPQHFFPIVHWVWSEVITHPLLMVILLWLLLVDLLSSTNSLKKMAIT
tara:strand:- start:301 stop:1512 length:1212 start_codon:yes stop_codon:yes gene_type:complete